MALQFLFNAMAPKADERFPFGGRPASLYTDNGPVTRSHVFHQVMDYLGIEVQTHLPRGHDGRRTTARAKGKVERPFRTVKEAHETLYHFHEPQTEAEANAWLFNYLLRYNDSPHRSESHSRMEDWVQHLPPEGLREMCSWERFCTFAREPETRKVAVDAQVSVAGVRYEVDPDLAGETVTVWFGLYDDQLYVEHGERRYGPYAPSGGPIPLHRYRSFKKTPTQQRADRIEGLAEQLALPRAALSDYPTLSSSLSAVRSREASLLPIPIRFMQLTFPSALDAKRAIADHLGMPLAKLSPEQLAALNTLLAQPWRSRRSGTMCGVTSILSIEDRLMLSDVMEHFGLSKSLRQVDDFETEHHRQLLKDLKAAIHEGGHYGVNGDCGQWENGAAGAYSRATAAGRPDRGGRIAGV